MELDIILKLKAWFNARYKVKGFYGIDNKKVYLFFYNLKQTSKKTFKKIYNLSLKLKRKKYKQKRDYDITNLITFSSINRNRLVKHNTLFTKLSTAFLSILENLSTEIRVNKINNFKYRSYFEIRSIIFINKKLIIRRNFNALKKKRTIEYNNYYTKIIGKYGRTIPTIVERFNPKAYVYRVWYETVHIKNKKYAKRYLNYQKNIIGTFKIIPRLTSINLEGTMHLTFIVAFIKWKPVFQTYKLFPSYSFSSNYFLNLLETTKTINKKLLRLPKFYYFIENKIFNLILLPKVIIRSRKKALIRLFLNIVSTPVFRLIGLLLSMVFLIPIAPLNKIFKILHLHLLWPASKILYRMNRPIVYLKFYLTALIKILYQYLRVKIIHNTIKIKIFTHKLAWSNTIKILIFTIILILCILDINYSNFIFNEYLNYKGFILFTASLILLLLTIFYKKTRDYVTNNIYIIGIFYVFIMYVLPKINYMDMISTSFLNNKKYNSRIEKIFYIHRKSKDKRTLINYLDSELYKDFYHFRKMLRTKITKENRIREEVLFAEHYPFNIPTQLSKKKQFKLFDIYIDDFFFSLAGVLFIIFVIIISILSINKNTTLTELNQELLNIRNSRTDDNPNWKELTIKYSRERNLYKNYTENIVLEYSWYYAYAKSWILRTSNYGYHYTTGTFYKDSLLYFADEKQMLSDIDYFQTKMEIDEKQYYDEREKAAMYGHINKDLYNYIFKDHPMNTLTEEDVPEIYIWQNDEDLHDEFIEQEMQETIFNDQISISSETSNLFRKYNAISIPSSQEDMEEYTETNSLYYLINEFKQQIELYPEGTSIFENILLSETIESEQLENDIEYEQDHVLHTDTYVKNQHVDKMTDLYNLSIKEEELILKNELSIELMYFNYKLMEGLTKKPLFLNEYIKTDENLNFYCPKPKKYIYADKNMYYYLETYLPIKKELLNTLRESRDYFTIELAKENYEKNERALVKEQNIDTIPEDELKSKFRINQIYETTKI